jgi:signal transduction histidine kinase/ActR/RegA family two-component response regulator
VNAQAPPIRWRPLWTLPRPGQAVSAGQALEVELAGPLIFANKPMLAAAHATAAAFWVVSWVFTRNPWILWWAACIHAALFQRWWASRSYARTAAADRQPLAALRNLRLAQGLTGAVWGLAAWALLARAGALGFSMAPLVMLVLLSMSAISMIALARFRDALLAFNTPLHLLLTTALAWQGGLLHTVLAVGAAVYFVCIIVYGLQQNALLVDYLRARQESDILAARLAHQVEVVERASAEKTRFFASASHDLRQPLHSLGLFGSAMVARLRGTQDEPVARNLMMCVDALEASFSSMLDVSKLDAGVVDAKPLPVALSSVFRRLESAYGRQAEGRGLALRFQPAGRWVQTDPALLERLLGNLVHNALKFTSTGGVLVLARRRQGKTSVEVWDTGAGMAPAELDLIFDEFYQIGNQERDRAKGLGMGLAIVQRLAQLLDAPLSVHSLPGKGSVFKVLLPDSRPQAAERLPAELASSAFRSLAGMCVLVVDDEAAVRDSTAAALRLYGLRIEVADSLEQAVRLVRQLGGGVDALITDHRLRGGEDGIAVAQGIHAALGQKVPTILVTGDTAPDRVRQARSSGMLVLYKPVRASALAEALRHQAFQTTVRAATW